MLTDHALMRLVPAVGDDGRSALAGMPADAHYYTRRADPVRLVPGDIIRHDGTWAVVSRACHDGLAGTSTLTVLSHQGEPVEIAMTAGDRAEAFTGYTIDPGTLHCLAQAAAGR
jgi:hypothetical protein